MGSKLVQDSSLTAVADAIREKAKITGPITFPTGFISEIGNIKSGGSEASATSVPINSSATLSIQSEA